MLNVVVVVYSQFDATDIDRMTTMRILIIVVAILICILCEALSRNNECGTPADFASKPTEIEVLEFA